MSIIWLPWVREDILLCLSPLYSRRATSLWSQDISCPGRKYKQKKQSPFTLWNKECLECFRTWNLMQDSVQIQQWCSVNHARVSCSARIQTFPVFLKYLSGLGLFAVPNRFISEATNDKCCAWPINYDFRLSWYTPYKDLGGEVKRLGIQICKAYRKFVLLCFKCKKVSIFPGSTKKFDQLERKYFGSTGQCNLQTF